MASRGPQYRTYRVSIYWSDVSPQNRGAITAKIESGDSDRRL